MKEEDGREGKEGGGRGGERSHIGEKNKIKNVTLIFLFIRKESNGEREGSLSLTVPDRLWGWKSKEERRGEERRGQSRRGGNDMRGGDHNHIETSSFLKANKKHFFKNTLFSPFSQVKL